MYFPHRCCVSTNFTISHYGYMLIMAFEEREGVEPSRAQGSHAICMTHYPSHTPTHCLGFEPSSLLKLFTCSWLPYNSAPPRVGIEPTIRKRVSPYSVKQIHEGKRVYSRDVTTVLGLVDQGKLCLTKLLNSRTHWVLVIVRWVTTHHAR